jgi:tetratricopeptide (TPR) repeat protein
MAAGPTLAARAAGFRSLGYLATWRGRIDEAAVQFEHAADASVQMGAPLTEVRNRLLLAWTHRLAGRQTAANNEMNRVMQLVSAPAMEPGFLSFIVTGLVRLDRLADAESVLSVLRSRVDSASDVDRAADALASGTVALANARPDSALWFGRRAAGFPQDLLVFSLLGDAHRALGQRDSAETALRRVIDADAFGAESQEVWLRAHVLLGDLLLSKGDTARARQTYQALLQRWREAPQTLPELVTARARLVALAGTSDR